MKVRGLVGPIVILLLCAGCGDDDDSGGGGDSGGGYQEPTPQLQREPVGPRVDAGCTSSAPKRSLVGGNGLWHACSNQDLTSVRVVNTSSRVLAVGPAPTSRSVSMMVTSPPPTTLSQQVVAAGYPSGQCPAGASCLVPPGASLSATGAPAQLTVGVSYRNTAVATVATGVSSWVTSKLQTRAQGYAQSIRACAQSVGQNLQPDAYLEDAVSQAIDGTATCSALINRVSSEANQPPPPRTQYADDVLRNLGSYSDNLRRDALKVAAIRAIKLVSRY